ncbi:MAG: dihydrodipicolinate synthase family protein [Chloroflexota bacterium]
MTPVDELFGIVPPILTPFSPDGRVDLISLAKLTRWLVGHGVHGIWACGTTGEFASLDAEEREDVIGTCVETVAERVPVVANISDCSTRLTIAHGKRAVSVGADAVAVTPPYYYLNTQDELLAHYRAVREAVDAPLFVYNIPQTVKTKVESGTVLTLAEEGTIVGMKDSQNDLDYDRTLLVEAARRGLKPRVLLGTRALIDAVVTIGAHGAIAGIANVAPRECVAAYTAAVAGDWRTAREAQERAMQVTGLTRGVKSGGNAASMGALKAALKAMGVIAHSTLSAPLRSPTVEEEARVAELVNEVGLRALATGRNGRG